TIGSRWMIITIPAPPKFPLSPGAAVPPPVPGVDPEPTRTRYQIERLITSPRRQIALVGELETRYREETESAGRMIIGGTEDTTAIFGATPRPMTSRVWVADREGYESFLPSGLTLNRDAFRVRLNANPPIGRDKEGQEYDTF